MYNYTKTLLLLGLLVLAGACDRAGDRTVLEGVTMGTNYSVVISGTPEPEQAALHQAIQERLDDINDIMSTYETDSELSRINRSHETEWIEVSEDLYRVLSKAVEISHLTGGAFDITVGPLVNLWGFGPEGGSDEVPEAEVIHAALQNTGYNKIKLGLTPPSIRKTQPDLYLDLSGIAKGFAVDAIASLLQARGVGDYMVDIGGEIRTAGMNPKGKSWRIGIEKPLTQGRSVQQVVSLSGKGMATSGDYRNYFEQDGVRYSHTLDPRTGYPIRHNLASVSVLHDSTMTADALATALLVMGPTEALAFASRNYLPAFFIINTEDGFIEQSTESFNQHLVEDRSGG